MQLNDTMYSKIMDIVDGVKRQEIWQDLKKREWKKQVVLQHNKMGICGMIDFLKIDGKHATIVDLKTANNAEPKKYFYHCLDYGYFLQMAFYRTLVGLNYPEVSSFDCYHLTVEKELYNCSLFKFDSRLIDGWVQVMCNTLEEMKQTTDFSPKSVGWQDEILIFSSPFDPQEV